jgi:hypothetical protein
MFKLLANLTDRRSWMVVLCAVVFAGVAGYYGGPVASLMTDGDGDFDDPASESVAAGWRRFCPCSSAAWPSSAPFWVSGW